MAADMAAATSHVHLTGWFLSPELALSREEEPLVVRILLAELAERVDVRVLLWKGAPIPAFRPSRGDVREMERTLARHTKIQTALDSCTGASHCHHEKTIVIDDRIAYVGGIDLTLDGGDPVRHAESPCAWRHRLARRRGADRGAGRARRGGALPPPLAGRDARDASAARSSRSRQAT